MYADFIDGPTSNKPPTRFIKIPAKDLVHVPAKDLVHVHVQDLCRRDLHGPKIADFINVCSTKR